MTDQPWPNLFIPGAPKCGTTSLHRYLDQHPQVHMSDPKEPHFFDFTWDELHDDNEAFAQATEAYLALFEAGAKADVRGESTPGYLHKPEVADRIAETVPEARFIVAARDPIERAHSDWWMLVRMDKEDRSFDEVMLAEIQATDPEERYHIRRGLYHEHVARYKDTFGEDNVHVMLMEDLKHDALGVLQEIARFLDIDPAPMDQVDHGTVHNPGGQPKNALASWLLTDERVHKAARAVLPKGLRVYLGDHVLVEDKQRPAPEPQTVRALVEVFEPSVAELEEMLGRDLPELRRSWDS